MNATTTIEDRGLRIGEFGALRVSGSQLSTLNSQLTSGFSLIEVMCAILVLGVAIVGLTEGITTALRSAKDGEIQTTAALLAAGQMESLRADGFVIDGDTEGDGDGALSNYHWRQSVTTTDIDGLHHVTVAVEWGDSGRTIYELETLLFDPPLLPSDDISSKKENRKKDRSRR